MKQAGRRPLRHPSEATLLDYAAGTIGIAHRLVIATHAARCAACRSTIRLAEQVGGILLDDLEAAPLKPAALSLCLAQRDALEAASRTFPSPSWEEHFSPPTQVGNVVLPRALQGLRPTKLRWLAPGVQHSTLFQDDKGTLHFVRVRPNTALPGHSHAGLELTCVLAGSFHDSSGEYQTDDVEEAGEMDDDSVGALQIGDSHDHLVVAGRAADCICIIATSGRVRFSGWLARLLQPIMPF